MAIQAISKVTFIEAMRNRSPYIVLLFGIVFIIVAKTLGYIASGEGSEKMILVAGLNGMTLFGTLFALFSGISLFQKELSQRTIYTILSKPVSRHQFIIGKFSGLMALYSLMVVSMALIFIITLKLHRADLTIEIFYYMILLVIELGLITSIAILFSLVVSPIFSAIATFIIFLAGNAMDTIYDRVLYLDASNWLGRNLILFVHMLIPNFYNFNITTETVNHYAVPFSKVGFVALYGLCYTGLILFASIVIFDRKRLQ